MMMKSVTWQQALVLIACVAGTLLAYQYLGERGGAAAATVGMVLNFLLGRGETHESQ
jgi:hypothetical protein